jgi:hypothetical protein
MFPAVSLPFGESFRVRYQRNQEPARTGMEMGNDVAFSVLGEEERVHQAVGRLLNTVGLASRFQFVAKGECLDDFLLTSGPTINSMAQLAACREPVELKADQQFPPDPSVRLNKGMFKAHRLEEALADRQIVKPTDPELIIRYSIEGDTLTLTNPQAILQAVQGQA